MIMKTLNPQELTRLIESARLPLTHEKDTQVALEKVLTAAGVAFEREVRLSQADIVDFMVGTTAVELKIKGSKTAIYRQVARYALHERVGHVMLVTGVAMALPSMINGKTTSVASLGVGWL